MVTNEVELSELSEAVNEIIYNAKNRLFNAENKSSKQKHTDYLEFLEKVDKKISKELRAFKLGCITNLFKEKGYSREEFINELDKLDQETSKIFKDNLKNNREF